MNSKNNIGELMTENIPVVILCGGMGTRLGEETVYRPKPMVEIGGYPILWHIMKIYSAYGLHNFIICCGYKGYMIKEYFANYFLHMSDVTFDMQSNKMDVHQHNAEPWRVTLIDTGEETMTGGRIKRIAQYVGNSNFCCTYGDGISDVNITELIKFHMQHGKYATLTAIQPPGRFGVLKLSGKKVLDFQEKPQGDGSWINGGFFVFSTKVFDYIDGDHIILEREPMNNLAKDSQIEAFPHFGFWHPMDTLRDKIHLEELWSKNQAPWKIW